MNEYKLWDIILDEYDRRCRVLNVTDKEIVYEFVNELKPDGSKNYAVITCHLNLVKPNIK